MTAKSRFPKSLRSGTFVERHGKGFRKASGKRPIAGVFVAAEDQVWITEAGERVRQSVPARILLSGFAHVQVKR